jgi:hypothetical protein
MIPACVAARLSVGEFEVMLVLESPPKAFANPKCRTFNRPSTVNLIFAGFRSLQLQVASTIHLAHSSFAKESSDLV